MALATTYMVVAVVNIDLPAAGTYEMRLTNGTDTLYAAVDLERAGHGTEVLVGVDKPPLGTPLVHSVDVRRAAGSGGITYHGLCNVYNSRMERGGMRCIK